MNKEAKITRQNITPNIIGEGKDDLTGSLLAIVNIQAGTDLNDVSQYEMRKKEDDHNNPSASLIPQSQMDINPETDLNDQGQLSQWDMEQVLVNKIISDEVYDDLPLLLKEPCDVLISRTDKEVFLIGAFGSISGILPNVVANYRGKEIESNLFAFVLANYGVGKGALEHAKKLLDPIHKQKRKQYNDEMLTYKEDRIIYEKALKSFNNSKSGELEPPTEPTRPGNYMLFAPVNNSKSGLYQLMAENKGRAILFDTEGDTLADSVKQDYGNFSDVLRKAFHHEAISFFRRTNDEYVDVDPTFLSVALSSTFDQFQKLVPTIENGLYSRFMYYHLPPNKVFDNVFDKNRHSYAKQFSEWGERFLKLYNYLDSLTKPIWFELQPHQEQKFLDTFQDYKDEMIEFVSPNMEGMANRMGIICFRLAMILSSLRELEKWNFTEKIICTDQDFNNALRIIDVLKVHSYGVYWKLQASILAKLGKSLESDGVKRQTCFQLKAEGKSVREIALIIKVSKSTVHRWLHGH